MKIHGISVRRPTVFCELCIDTGTVSNDADPDNDMTCPECHGDPYGHWEATVAGSIENDIYDRIKEEV